MPEPIHNASVSGLQKLYAWLDERFHFAPLMALAAHKKVPVHRHSVWYYMGGIALMLLAIQVVTGILLSIYYIPELSSANASVLKLTTKVEFGWFIRSLHSWAANLLIAVVFLHMFSAYFLKAYRSPRELTWWSGLVLLVLMMAFGFTGYLLPWDEVAFFATKIGLDIASKTPFVGEFIANILRGGPQISQATLSRFFALHVFVLPLGLMALLGVHLWLVQSLGMSEPRAFKKLPPEKQEYEAFFPTFILKDAMVWLLFFNVLAACATLAPWSLGKEADPFAAAPDGIKPEWYFLAMFQFLKLMPPTVGPIEGEMLGVGFFAVLAALLGLMPVLDRNPLDEGFWGRWATAFGIVLLIGFITFTLWGMLS